MAHPRKSYINQKFNFLTIIDEKWESGIAFVRCKCDCGTVTDWMYRNNIVKGTIQSCGCQHYTNHIQSYINKTFNYLTIIEEKIINHKTYVKCQCKCGKTTKWFLRQHVIDGHTKSCGCMGIPQNRKSYINCKFNMLTIIEEKFETGQPTMVRCQCDCGNITKWLDRRQVVTGDINSCGCTAFSRGENLISDFLLSQNIHFIRQFRFSDCKDKNTLPFDFYVDNTFCIEYDGEQHFIPNDYFGGEEAFKIRQYHDQLKNEYCQLHNIPLLRLDYTMTTEQIEQTIMNFIKCVETAGHSQQCVC